MQNSLSNNDSSGLISNTISVKEQIFNYLQYWKWFVLSVFLCLAVVFTYLRYYVVEYGVASSILIKDEKKGGNSEYSAFGDLNIFSAKNNVDNEIAVLKSRTISQTVVQNLDLDITYFTEGRVVSRELYGDENPIKIVFINKVNNYYKKDTSFVVKIISKDKFSISDIEKKTAKIYSFNRKVHSTLGDFVITHKSNSDKKKF